MAFMQRFTFLRLRQVHFLRKPHNSVTLCMDKYEEILNKPNVQEEEFKNMRKDLVDAGDMPLIVDSVVLDRCRANNSLNGGIAYYKFLLKNNYKPCAVTTGKFFKLYALMRDQDTQEDKEFILKLYNSVIEEFPMLDNKTIEACAESLCAIGEWQEALKLLERHKPLGSSFLIDGWSALVNYFYKHGQVTLGYKYLDICCKKNNGPKPYVYSTYLKYCLKERETFNENIEKIFNLWRKYDIKPNVSTVQQFMEACNKVGWCANFTRVTNSWCKICGHKMTKVTLSDEEFKHLSKMILNKIFLANQGLGASINELNHFMKFIEETKPYDVIIDGLNIVLNGKRDNFVALCNVIRYYNEKKQKVLVILREHYLRKRQLQNLQTKASFYFVKDSSEDDPFILYAAMASGQNCKVVSKDSMREHKFNLSDNELRVLFKKWQLTHQEMYVNDFLGHINEDYYYSTCYFVQKHDDYWHIPFQRTSSFRRNQALFDEWACFKMCT